ncbi:UNVERIFIED_CONTAM: Origin of replication complex subunit [Sesamum angustifolium]|uniref:Origin of replication complex subunit n=1 Tax=Sesamum angustifolium TaxID=2727405 RepID=A0AAW2M7N7_9LAMI
MMIATRFSAICHMDMNSGFLSVENFKSALPSIQRQPKLEALKRLLSSRALYSGLHEEAFEHLLDRALISFEDNKGHGQSAEFRPVKLLISWHELHQGLKSHRSCPVRSIFQKSKIEHAN